MSPKCSSRTSDAPSSVPDIIGPGHTVRIEVTVNRRPKFEYYHSHSFMNRFLLAIVLVTLLYINRVSPIDDLKSKSNTTECYNRWGCTNCTSLPPPCIWSNEKQKCYTDKDTITMNMTGNLMVSNRTFCPKFEVMTSRSKSNKAIVTVTSHSDSFIGYLLKSRLTCQIGDYYYNATVVQNTIYCTNHRLTPNISLVEDIADYVTIYYLSVVFNGNRLVFDNLCQHYVKVYKSRDCGTVPCKSCMWNDYRYMVYCARCTANDACSVINEYQYCDIKTLSDRQDAGYKSPIITLNKIYNTAIRRFEPASAPWTEITDFRIELHKHVMLLKNHGFYDDIAVEVAGHDCSPVMSFGNGTVHCTLVPAVHKTNVTTNIGQVTIQFKSDVLSFTLAFQSDSDFHFIDPKITSFQPTWGPATGDTRLKISGEFFGSNTDLRVTVADVACKIISRSQNQVECVTGTAVFVAGQNQTTNKTADAVPLSLSGRVKLVFGRHLIQYNVTLFEFVADPTVTAGQNFSGFVSGGTNLFVRGERFSFLTDVKMCVRDHFDSTHHCGLCRVLNDTCMACRSPPIESINPMRMIPVHFQANFATKLVKFYPPSDSAFYRLYQNPSLVDFTLDGCCNVTINGEYLGNGYGAEELSVRSNVNRTECVNVSVTSSQIYCQLLPLNPLPDVIYVTTGDGLYNSTVNINKRNPGAAIGFLALMVLPNFFTLAYIVFSFVTLLCVIFFGLKSSLKYDPLTLQRRNSRLEMERINRRQSNFSDDENE